MVGQISMGICDDEKYAHDMVEEYIKQICLGNKISIKIYHYYSRQELLDSCDRLDGLFLDIDMPEMDGIELGLRLRKNNVSYKIIMLTAREDRYREAFKINAFRFISKPVRRDDFDEAILALCQSLDNDTEVSVFKNRKEYKISQKIITFIESKNSETRVYTEDCEYRSEMSLKSWMEILDQKSFYQSSRSYIVNMRYVKEIEKNQIRLETGELVECARRSKKDFIHAYVIYDTRWRRC